MSKIVRSCALFLWLTLFATALYGEMLEVRLPTRSSAQPVYISRVHTDPSEWDWRYFDDLRGILEFDLNTGGFSTVAPIRQELEESFDWPELRQNFAVDLWKKESFPYVFTLEVHQKQCTLTAFDILQKSSKRYPSFPLSGSLAADRRAMHRLADALHNDLFDADGLASLRILYSQRTKNTESDGLGWLSEVWICDSDGANARQVTNGKGYCLSPGFLPSTGDDPEFFYVYNDEGQSKIYKASLSKPEGKPLISLRGSQALPSLSKQGNQMAFITDVAGRPDLFLQHLDVKKNPFGRSRQIFSSPRATQASPTFSPTGKQIAFVSDKDGSPRIYLLDIPGPKETQRPRPRLLTTKNRENTSPAWSPDGKRIAYAAKADGVRQIWIYDVGSGEEFQLTTGPETKENPSWAPDSLHLVYNTESDENSELYLIHLSNPEPLLISRGPGQKRFASWELRPVMDKQQEK